MGCITNAQDEPGFFVTPKKYKNHGNIRESL
jgi:hypothetical protein